MDAELTDAVRSLPSDFVSTYQLLFERALRVGSSGANDAGEVGVAGASRVTRLSSGQTETRGGAKSGKKSGGSRVPIRSEASLAFKGKMDRRLRAITREIKFHLDGVDVGEALRRCTVCRTFGESSWLYCPRDGKPMESMDREKA